MQPLHPNTASSGTSPVAHPDTVQVTPHPDRESDHLSPVQRADAPPRGDDAPEVPVATSILPHADAAAVAVEGVRLERPARILLGWLSDNEAHLMQTGRRPDVTLTPAQQAAILSARAAVAARLEGIDQTGIVTSAPATIDEHLSCLRQQPALASLFAQNEVALVDLQRVCALQPHVFVDYADERVASLDPNDSLAIARLTLPLSVSTVLHPSFDSARPICTISARNPNLRVVGMNVQAQPGALVVSYAVAVTASFLSVARLNGRYILVDGYHRAAGLLRRGITKVPALVREASSIEQLGLPPTGLLPSSVYLGSRPPILLDYIDDTVSVDTRLPTTVKLVVLQAIEATHNS